MLILEFMVRTVYLVAVMASQNGPTANATVNQRYEYVNANNTLFDNYIDGPAFQPDQEYMLKIL